MPGRHCGGARGGFQGAKLVTNKSQPNAPNCWLMLDSLKNRQPTRLVSVLTVALLKSISVNSGLPLSSVQGVIVAAVNRDVERPVAQRRWHERDAVRHVAGDFGGIVVVFVRDEIAAHGEVGIAPKRADHHAHLPPVGRRHLHTEGRSHSPSHPRFVLATKGISVNGCRRNPD